VEISGDEADESAAGAGVFHIGDSFKFLRSPEIADGIDELRKSSPGKPSSVQASGEPFGVLRSVLRASKRELMRVRPIL